MPPGKKMSCKLKAKVTRKATAQIQRKKKQLSPEEYIKWTNNIKKRYGK